MSVFVSTYSSIQYRMLNTDFTNSLTSALFAEAADSADEYIRAKLACRYDVSSAYFQTTASAPPMLKKTGEWLAIAYMLEGLSRGGKDQIAKIEKYEKRADSFLDKLCSFNSNLVDSLGSIIASSSNNHPGVSSNTNDYSPTFNEDSPLNWEVDPDKLDDIADDRD